MAQGFRFSARPLVAAALLTLTAAPVAAQYGAPPRPPAMPEAPRQGPEAPATPAVTAAPLSEVHRAAACLIGGEDAALAPALLATAPSSPAERDQAIRTIRRAERCLGPRTRIATSALMLRGAIAETLYETNFAQPQAPHNPVTTMAAWFNPAEATARPDAAAMASSYALADCTVAANPDLVRALLATAPQSEAETAAIRPLNAVFNRCVVPGTTLSVDQAGIRAILGESLYRWSVVQRDGPTSPWATPAAAAN